MLSPLWCQWDKSRQQLMCHGAISVTIGRGKNAIYNNTCKRNVACQGYHALLWFHHHCPPHHHHCQGHKHCDKSISLLSQNFFFSLKHVKTQQAFVAFKYSPLSYPEIRKIQFVPPIGDVTALNIKDMNWQRWQFCWIYWWCFLVWTIMSPLLDCQRKTKKVA